MQDVFSLNLGCCKENVLDRWSKKWPKVVTSAKTALLLRKFFLLQKDWSFEGFVLSPTFTFCTTVQAVNLKKPLILPRARAINIRIFIATQKTNIKILFTGSRVYTINREKVRRAFLIPFQDEWFSNPRFQILKNWNVVSWSFIHFKNKSPTYVWDNVSLYLLTHELLILWRCFS